MGKEVGTGDDGGLLALASSILYGLVKTHMVCVECVNGEVRIGRVILSELVVVGTSVTETIGKMVRLWVGVVSPPV